MSVILTSENFDCEIYDSTKPVLVEFWAERCPACRTMKPILERFDGQSKDVKLCLLNVDEEPSLADRFSVKSIPTLLLFHRGAEIDRRIGSCSLGELNAFCKQTVTRG